ncbi:hypothetical protein CDD83_5881 [Cordyceps sp. RAO-2017]|nr:hypothetical protein CDD83_5881 [Cordyceps sp. RAO-2017]
MPNDNADDIRAYAKERISDFCKLRATRRDLKLSQDEMKQIEDFICSRSDGMFLAMERDYVGILLTDARLRHVSLRPPRHRVPPTAAHESNGPLEDEGGNLAQETRAGIREASGFDQGRDGGTGRGRAALEDNQAPSGMAGLRKATSVMARDAVDSVSVLRHRRAKDAVQRKTATAASQDVSRVSGAHPRQRPHPHRSLHGAAVSKEILWPSGAYMELKAHILQVPHPKRAHR